MATLLNGQVFGGGWLELIAACAVGVALALTVAFLRWRFRRKVVSGKEWDELVSGYVEMERTVSKVDRERTESVAELATISGRLEEAIEENNQLRSRLRNLEGNLENVTREATMLVNGLRDNERRWEQAEAKYLRTEEELKRSTAALEEEITRSFELGEALQVERNQTNALRAANEELTKQLAERTLPVPTVDLRDQNWSTRRWRRTRAGRLFSHSHGRLPD